MKIAVLVESADHVCCRYRFSAFQKPLAGAGHELELVPYPRNWLDRFRLGNRIGQADVIVVQRKLLPAWQLALLRRRCSRLIFDFDDAVFLRDSYNRKSSQSRSRWMRFRTMCQWCDAVICGNSWLADHASRAGSRNCVVIPTCVDPSIYPTSKQDSSQVRLVWVGSSSTLQGLERARPIFESLSEAVEGIRLKLVCDRFARFGSLPVEEVRWSESTEAQEIAAAEIGVAWIPDDDWSRGKCGLKVLQYMAAGLPVIANPVGVHTEMVRHSETGFLASTQNEWLAAVQTLGRSVELRKQMGQKGREIVEREYSVQTGARLWCDWLAGVSNIRPRERTVA